MRKFGILLAAGLAAASVAAQAPVQAQDIGIGLDIPLSAPGDASGGQLIRRGAEIGIETVNAAGGVLGKKLKLYVTDSQSTPQMGVANYRRLVSEDKVVAVTGMFHSSVALGINEVAKEMGVPTLAVQASASDITAKHYDIAFRTHAVDPVRVAAWMEFIKKKGFKKVSIIAETTDYGIGLTDETLAQNKAGKFGLDIQKITFDNKATDFTPQLLQIKAFKPDLVLNIAVGQPVDLIMDQATTIGLLPATPMLISYDAPTRPQYWQLHPKNGDGIYFIAYYSPKAPLSDLGQTFAKTYKEKYKEDPVYGALNGYGAIMILTQALKAANSTDPKALIKALETGTFKPDLVLNIAVGQPVDLIMDQATTIGLLPATPMLISYDAPTRPQYWQLHPKNGDGIYFIAYYSPKAPLSDLGQAFAKTYKEKYKEDPVYGALNGYGAIMILTQALKAANSTDPKALIKALETGTFKSWPDAPVTFPRADGVYWHNWVPPVLIVQYTKPMQDWKEADVVLTYVKK